MPTREQVDLLIEARSVLPIVPAVELEHHGVAVLDGRILAIGPAAELRDRFAPREHVVRSAHVLFPGFVDAHTSASRMALPTRDWTRDLARDGAQLALAEMLRAGITSFASTELHPEEMAHAAAALRMRAAVGLPLSEQPTDSAQSLTDHLAAAERLWDDYRSDPWVSLYFAPDFARGLTATALARVRTVADELDARIVMPVGVEPGGVRAREDRAPLPSLSDLNQLGLLRPGFTALPLYRLAPAEHALIERTGIALAVCPQASLRAGRGSGALSCLIEPLAVGLGTGTPPLALAFDLLAEARAAALAASELAVRTDALSPQRALELATLGGAQAIGLKSTIGSLEPGKAADLIAIEVGTHHRPETSTAEIVLYAATRRHVSDVWIHGRPQVLDGRLVALDERELTGLAERYAHPEFAGAARARARPLGRMAALGDSVK